MAQAAVSGASDVRGSQRRRGPNLRSLKARVVLVVAAAVIPLVALQIFGAMRARRAAEDAGHRSALGVARLAAAHLKLYVGSAQEYLEVIAQGSDISAVVRRNGGACERLVRALEGGPRFAQVAVLDARRNVVCLGSRRDATQLSRERVREVIDPALRARAPTPVHITSGRRTTTLFVLAARIAAPDGREAGVVAATLNTNSLREIARAATLAQGSVLSVVTRDGIMLLRYPEDRGWAGRDVRHIPLYRNMAGAVEGASEGTGIDGIDRLSAFTTVTNAFAPGLQRVAVGTPMHAVLAPASRVHYESIFLLLVISTLGLGAAVALSERTIHAPTTKITQAAERIAGGDMHVRADLDSGIEEFRALGRAFDEMAAAMEQRVIERTAELEKANVRLATVTQNKSEFLAEMSHELRTPLNAIIGFSQLLHDQRVGALSEQQREYVGDVLISATHLLRIVNDILDLTKVEAGKMTFVPAPFDVKQLAEEVCDGLRPLADERGVDITLHVSDGLDGVVGDGKRFKQVLYNYVSNALKVAPRGDLVVVRMVAADPASFKVTVEDTGPGIAAADVRRLFKKYEQVAGSDSRGGTGLGLALTRRIVEAQGGSAGVVSVEGKGSSFFAVLPRDLRVALVT